MEEEILNPDQLEGAGEDQNETFDDLGDSQEAVDRQETPQPSEDNTISFEEWQEFQAFKASKASQGTQTPEPRQEAHSGRPDANEAVSQLAKNIVEKFQYGDETAVTDLLGLVDTMVRSQTAPIVRQTIVTSVEPEVRPFIEAAEKELGVPLSELPPNQRDYIIKSARAIAKTTEKPKVKIPKAPSGAEDVVPAARMATIPAEFQSTYREYLRDFKLTDTPAARKEFLSL